MPVTEYVYVLGAKVDPPTLVRKWVDPVATYELDLGAASYADPTTMCPSKAPASRLMIAGASQLGQAWGYVG